MKLPIFEQHRDCTSCSISKMDPASPGMATRRWDGDSGKKRKDTALLILGSSPGRAEDRDGKPFVGPAGEYCNRSYIRAMDLHNFADVYLTNAVRCCPRENTVTVGHVKACRSYLIEDVAELAKFHKKIVLLACGAEARNAVLGETSALGTFPQGSVQKIGEISVVVFSTDNPVMLLPGRDPSARARIFEHLLLVRRFLETGTLHDAVVLPDPSALVGDSVLDPPATTTLLSLDIETYGGLAGFKVAGDKQQFHWEKMLYVDKVERSAVVRTVGLAWRDHEGRMRGKVYRMSKLRERLALLRVLGRPRLRLLGQNLPFDVQTLRAFDVRFRRLLTPARVTLIELMVRSFLENDMRVERGLKQAVVVGQIDDYYDDPVDLRKGERYDSDDDPRLWTYNIKDCFDTLLLYEKYGLSTEMKYGSTSPKLSPYSEKWYSDGLWLAIRMSENGILYDKKLLLARLAKYNRVIEWALDKAQSTWGLKLGGEGSGYGSKTGVPAMMADLVERWTPVHPQARREFLSRLEMTDGDLVSTKQANVGLLLGVVPPGEPDRDRLRLLAFYRRCCKIRDSYLNPMLGVKGELADRLVKATAFPLWHVVPGRSNDNDDKEGGTKQGRWTCRNHAKQTEPPVIEKCVRSRFPGGAFISCDESQIELRIPAAMSHDKNMLKVFEKGWSLHAKTGAWLLKIARGIDADWIENNGKTFKKAHPDFYMGGKTINFLRLFGGSAFKMQRTLLGDLDLLVPMHACEKFLEQDKAEYATMYAWQAGLVEKARAQGYLELPLIGISRTFLGDIDKTYIPTILNFPVQTTAAWITQSAQIEVQRRFDAAGMKTLTIGNTYDEGLYDAPADEVEVVKPLLLEVFRNPPIWKDLQAVGLYPVPLDAEVVVRYNPSTRGTRSRAA